MSKKCVFDKNSVLESEFEVHSDFEEQKDLEVNINGNILVPKELKKGSDVRVTLDFSMGNDKQEFYFRLKFLSIYLIQDIDCLDEKVVERECLSDALIRLNDTIEKNLLLYGLEKIEFPDFPTN